VHGRIKYRPPMNMTALPKERVHHQISLLGGQVIAVREHLGSDAVHYCRYLVTKPCP
jgi:hypothetical protein